MMTQFLQFDLGLSPLQAGLRILPMAGMLVVCAVLSPLVVRAVGTKLTVGAALAAVAGGLWQIAASSSAATSYGDVVVGLLLIGLGAGFLLPTATNSVVGSVPQGCLLYTSRGMSAPLAGRSNHRWSVLVVLCAAALIINVDNTILNVALPTLVRELHATSSQLQWIVDSYAMVFAGLLLVSGSLADRFGRKRFFLLGLCLLYTSRCV